MSSDQEEAGDLDKSSDAPVKALDIGLEQLLPGSVILTGGRDVRGAPVIECHQRTAEQQAMGDSAIVHILKYLCRVPRFESHDMGVSLVIDTRDVSEDALQEMVNAVCLLHEYDSKVIDMIYVVAPSEGGIHELLAKQSTGEGPLQLRSSFKVLFEVSELFNYIAPDQLTADFGGSLQYNHEEWIRFRFTIEPFIGDCRSCAKKLKAAVSEERSGDEDLLEKLHVDQLIQEARQIVSRLCDPPPDWSSLAWSPDYRGVIAYIEQLCGQLEKLKAKLRAVATGAKKKNGSAASMSSCSSQQAVEKALEFIQTEGVVFLRNQEDYADSLGSAQLLLQDFVDFETNAKELCEYGKHCAEELLSSDTATQHSARARQLQQRLQPFIASLSDRRKRLDTVLEVHKLVNKAFSWSVNSSRFLGQQQVLSNATDEEVSTKLNDCRSFAATHSGLTDQEMSHLKEIALSLKHPRASTQADIAILASQEADSRFKSRLELLERLQKRGSKLYGTADFDFSTFEVSDSGGETSEDDEDTLVEETQSDDSGFNMSLSLTSAIAVVAGRERANTLHRAKTVDPEEPDTAGLATAEQELMLMSVTWEHMAAASRLSTIEGEDDTVSTEELAEEFTEEVEGDEPDDASVVEPDGGPPSDDLSPMVAMTMKRKRLMQELVETEERYVDDLEYVCKNYLQAYLTSDMLPNSLRGKVNVIFGNITSLFDFNKNEFLPHLRRHVNTPLKIGCCFTQFEHGFGQYSLYFKIMPQQERLLVESPGYDFFRSAQIRLNDPMGLLSYLIKPFQRMTRYRQFLENVKKYAPPGLHGKSADDLELALKQVSFQLRHGNDLMSAESLKGFDGNLVEQGLLILQDEFIVTYRKASHKRRLFLFEEMIIFSKPKKVKGSGDMYDYRTGLKTADMGLTESVADSACKFEIWFRKRKKNDIFVLQTENEAVKAEWVKEIHNLLYRQIQKLKEQAIRTSATFAVAPKRRSMNQRPPSTYSDPRSVLARSSYTDDIVSQSSTSTVINGGMWTVMQPEAPAPGQLAPDKISITSSRSEEGETRHIDESDSGCTVSGKILTGLPDDPYRDAPEDSV